MSSIIQDKRLIYDTLELLSFLAKVKLGVVKEAFRRYKNYVNPCGFPHLYNIQGKEAQSLFKSRLDHTPRSHHVARLCEKLEDENGTVDVPNLFAGLATAAISDDELDNIRLLFHLFDFDETLELSEDEVVMLFGSIESFFNSLGILPKRSTTSLLESYACRLVQAFGEPRTNSIGMEGFQQGVLQHCPPGIQLVLDMLQFIRIYQYSLHSMQKVVSTVLKECNIQHSFEKPNGNLKSWNKFMGSMNVSRKPILLTFGPILMSRGATFANISLGVNQATKVTVHLCIFSASNQQRKLLGQVHNFPGSPQPAFPTQAHPGQFGNTLLRALSGCDTDDLLLVLQSRTVCASQGTPVHFRFENLKANTKYVAIVDKSVSGKLQWTYRFSVDLQEGIESVPCTQFSPVDRLNFETLPVDIPSTPLAHNLLELVSSSNTSCQPLRRMFNQLIGPETEAILSEMNVKLGEWWDTVGQLILPAKPELPGINYTLSKLKVLCALGGNQVCHETIVVTSLRLLLETWLDDGMFVGTKSCSESVENFWVKYSVTQVSQLLLRILVQQVPFLDKRVDPYEVVKQVIEEYCPMWVHPNQPPFSVLSTPRGPVFESDSVMIFTSTSTLIAFIVPKGNVNLEKHSNNMNALKKIAQNYQFISVITPLPLLWGNESPLMLNDSTIHDDETYVNTRRFERYCREHPDHNSNNDRVAFERILLNERFITRSNQQLAPEYSRSRTVSWQLPVHKNQKQLVLQTLCELGFSGKSVAVFCRSTPVLGLHRSGWGSGSLIGKENNRPVLHQWVTSSDNNQTVKGLFSEGPSIEDVSEVDVKHETVNISEKKSTFVSFVNTEAHVPTEKRICAPCVTLGPVIGRVSDTFAVILIEMNQDTTVRVVCTPVLSICSVQRSLNSGTPKRVHHDVKCTANKPAAFKVESLQAGTDYVVTLHGLAKYERRCGRFTTLSNTMRENCKVVGSIKSEANYPPSPRSIALNAGQCSTSNANSTDLRSLLSHLEFSTTLDQQHWNTLCDDDKDGISAVQKALSLNYVDGIVLMGGQVDLRATRARAKTKLVQFVQNATTYEGRGISELTRSTNCSPEYSKLQVEILEDFRNAYRTQWNHPLMKRILSSGTHMMMMNPKLDLGRCSLERHHRNTVDIQVEHVLDTLATVAFTEYQEALWFPERNAMKKAPGTCFAFDDCLPNLCNENGNMLHSGVECIRFFGSCDTITNSELLLHINLTAFQLDLLCEQQIGKQCKCLSSYIGAVIASHNEVHCITVCVNFPYHVSKHRDSSTLDNIGNMLLQDFGSLWSWKIADNLQRKLTILFPCGCLREAGVKSPRCHGCALVPAFTYGLTDIATFVPIRSLACDSPRKMDPHSESKPLPEVSVSSSQQVAVDESVTKPFCYGNGFALLNWSTFHISIVHGAIIGTSILETKLQCCVQSVEATTHVVQIDNLLQPQATKLELMGIDLGVDNSQLELRNKLDINKLRKAHLCCVYYGMYLKVHEMTRSRIVETPNRVQISGEKAPIEEENSDLAILTCNDIRNDTMHEANEFRDSILQDMQDRNDELVNSLVELTKALQYCDAQKQLLEDTKQEQLDMKEKCSKVLEDLEVRLGETRTERIKQYKIRRVEYDEFYTDLQVQLEVVRCAKGARDSLQAYFLQVNDVKVSVPENERKGAVAKLSQEGECAQFIKAIAATSLDAKRYLVETAKMVTAGGQIKVLKDMAFSFNSAAAAPHFAYLIEEFQKRADELMTENKACSKQFAKIMKKIDGDMNSIKQQGLELQLLLDKLQNLKRSIEEYKQELERAKLLAKTKEDESNTIRRKLFLLQQRFDLSRLQFGYRLRILSPEFRFRASMECFVNWNISLCKKQTSHNGSESGKAQLPSNNSSWVHISPPLHCAILEKVLEQPGMKQLNPSSHVVTFDEFQQLCCCYLAIFNCIF